MKKIEDAQKMVEKDVLGLDDITCVYIGEKDNKEVIKVGIKKKDSDITKRIPKQVEGYDVEVEFVEQASIDW